MQIQENFSLRPFNTFGIDANARFFAGFDSASSLARLLDAAPAPLKLVLGGGSNILLTGNVDGLVLRNEVRDIAVVEETEDAVFVKAGAGENWHQFVLHCIGNDWGGLENLSLIPGHVGASPMQNIGAYGVELREVFHTLDAYDLESGEVVQFAHGDCEFGYRDSVFKNRYRGRFVILSVTFRLQKKPQFNTSYGAMEEELEKMGVRELSIRAISDAIIRIRSSKLPDPAKTGNAGSFFKNPAVTSGEFERLQRNFPGIVGYALGGDQYKLAAGWLIEQCGWKGFRRGDAGCHHRQALVLVNHGHATGQEIYRLSQEILESVYDKFGVTLEREVNIIPS